MSLNVQYLHDAKGKPRAVQVPIRQWEALVAKLAEYEFATKLKQDLQEALSEVKRMNAGEKPKRSIQERINEI